MPFSKIMRNAARTAGVFSLCLGLHASTASAQSLGADMRDFYSNVGITSNATSAQAYGNLNEGGYATGGSLTIRIPQKTVVPLSAQLPSISAGCNGIDAHAGALSFAGVDEYIDLLRNIAANSTGYAFKLALEAISPTIADTIDEIQQVINAINGFQIQSCDAARFLVDGVVENHRVGVYDACVQKKMATSTDRAQAKAECQGDVASTVSGLSDAEKETLLEGNIVWKALMGVDYLKSDPDRAETIMTYTGSIIYPLPSDDNSALRPRALPAIVLDDSLINAFLEGGGVYKFDCDTVSDCENPARVTETIAATDGLNNAVALAINDMQQSARLGLPLSREALQVMSATSLPLYRYVNVMSAYSAADGLIERSTLAEYVAIDIFLQQVDQAYTIALQSLRLKVTLPVKERNYFIDSIEKNRQFLAEKRASIDSKLLQGQQFVRQLDAIERRLSSRLQPSFLNQAGFSGGNVGN